VIVIDSNNSKAAACEIHRYFRSDEAA
jgi:hypothetical protein